MCSKDHAESAVEVMKGEGLDHIPECLLMVVFPAQEPGSSPCPSTCPEISKSQALGSLSESGAVLVEVCCLVVLAAENKV